MACLKKSTTLDSLEMSHSLTRSPLSGMCISFHKKIYLDAFLLLIFFPRCSAIMLHAVLRLQPMLEQLTEGLKLFGLLSLIRRYPDICRPLFVPGEDIKVRKNDNHVH